MYLFPLLAVALIGLFQTCSTETSVGWWDCTIAFSNNNESYGTMKIEKSGDGYTGSVVSHTSGTMMLKDIAIEGNKLSSDLKYNNRTLSFRGEFSGDTFSGLIFDHRDTFSLAANRIPADFSIDDLQDVTYLMEESDLSNYEQDLDHAGLIAAFDREGYRRGARIYNANCINCHGNPEMEGSIPLSLKFWEQPFKTGNDPFSMYQTITRGYGSMPPQVTFTPQEKYDVVLYIRENFVRRNHQDEYFTISPSYLSALPEGSSKGPAAKPYHPWSDMDYGNFLINTYELVDSATGPKRFHSPGPRPYPDENYLENNFAYKGIAVRVDEGPGGVSDGNAWMMFDHDLMRVAGGWTGEGFIDWEGILLNDKHETYPRTIGKLHFETPVGPGWANPYNGSYEDPRFMARDGRQFGPLPKNWAAYNGLYHSGDNIIISYQVGNSTVLELLGKEKLGEQIVFTRTLNISPSANPLQMRIAPIGTQVALKGEGASLDESDGFVVLNVSRSNTVKVILFIANPNVKGFEDFARQAPSPESLVQYTRGGESHYPQVLKTTVVKGKEDGPIAVDQLTIPFNNPWDSRMKLSGIDFMADANIALVCTVGGDVWRVNGLTDNTGELTWKRIASGLFQPLGIKVVDGEIFVTCRDQIVQLKDFNGDGETDFYKSFNHDHQVTDHFHEFAMGLQADQQGNLYYAKSGRHAREALIPQHGTLIKVSRDGKTSKIIATGFRAANGICINPDGSFIVTDQQGFWNPMNRINWVDGNGKFYGNMWGYNPPEDTTRSAMESPLVWVDMEFDRSPSELVWVTSDEWGPLNGSLLSFSYGYGKVQLVFHESVNNQMQGGVVDIPGIKFMTGVMRGRFNPQDGQLYACGLSAWGTNQMIKGGGFYRLRYTGQPLTIPLELHAEVDGIKFTFATPLEPGEARKISSYQVKTWELVRSSKYGSDRINPQNLIIDKVELSEDARTVKLVLPNIKPVDVMTVEYDLMDAEATPLRGIFQNTIHNLGHQEPMAQNLID